MRACSFPPAPRAARGRCPAAARTLPGPATGRPPGASHADRAGAGDGRRTQSPSRARYWPRSEEHTSELQSLMRISYAVFCLKKKTYIIRLTLTFTTITQINSTNLVTKNKDY